MPVDVGLDQERQQIDAGRGDARVGRESDDRPAGGFGDPRDLAHVGGEQRPEDDLRAGADDRLRRLRGAVRRASGRRRSSASRRSSPDSSTRQLRGVAQRDADAARLAVLGQRQDHADPHRPGAERLADRRPGAAAATGRSAPARRRRRRGPAEAPVRSSCSRPTQERATGKRATPWRAHASPTSGVSRHGASPARGPKNAPAIARTRRTLPHVCRRRAPSPDRRQTSRRLWHFRRRMLWEPQGGRGSKRRRDAPCRQATARRGRAASRRWAPASRRPRSRPASMSSRRRSAISATSRLRALATLAGADAILAEDTRVTRRLLDRYGIATPLIAYHEHNADRGAPALLARLAEGAGAGAGLRRRHAAGLRSRLQAGARGARRRASPSPPCPAPRRRWRRCRRAALPTDRFFFEGFLPAKSGGAARADRRAGADPGDARLLRSAAAGSPRRSPTSPPSSGRGRRRWRAN